MIAIGREGDIWTKVRGSHRECDRIRKFLKRDPQFHGGMAGKGCCCCYVSQDEFDRLKAAGFKVTRR